MSIGGTSYRTVTIRNNYNPVWQETFKFEQASSDLLIIEVWELDTGARGDDDHLGTCVVALKPEQNEGDYNPIECVVVDGGRVKVFFKCYS